MDFEAAFLFQSSSGRSIVNGLENVAARRSSGRAVECHFVEQAVVSRDNRIPGSASARLVALNAISILSLASCLRREAAQRFTTVTYTVLAVFAVFARGSLWTGRPFGS